MRVKKRPPIPVGRDGGQQRNRKFINKKNYTGMAFERATKNWAVDRMAESLFEGKKSSLHKLALAFWKKNGRRLRRV